MSAPIVAIFCGVTSINVGMDRKNQRDSTKAPAVISKMPAIFGSVSASFSTTQPSPVTSAMEMAVMAG